MCVFSSQVHGKLVATLLSGGGGGRGAPAGESRDTERGKIHGPFPPPSTLLLPLTYLPTGPRLPSSLFFLSKEEGEMQGGGGLAMYFSEYVIISELWRARPELQEETKTHLRPALNLF
jgi:hypothetical protein